MIRHICMFRLKTKEDGARFIREAQSLKEIAQVKGFDAVANDPRTPESNYDVSLIMDFESTEDLDSYQKDPIHLKFGEFLAPIKVDRACIDYEY